MELLLGFPPFYLPFLNHESPNHSFLYSVQINHMNSFVLEIIQYYI